MPKNRSKQNKQSQSYDEDELLDFYINNNKNNKSNIEQSTPLADTLKNKKKEQLTLKLKNAIQLKNNMRFRPDKKLINEQTEQIENMMKHPKMTQQILELYARAVASDMTKTLPTPIDIFNNIEQYKKQYYQYILELLNKIKQEKLEISHLNVLLDNPYGHYMSKCLDCPLNPFTKTNTMS
jgi:hypothetical protein